MRIVDVKTTLLKGGPQGPNAEGHPPPSGPLSIFPPEDRVRQMLPWRVSGLLVEIVTDAGLTGASTVGMGREAHREIIDKDLKPIILDEDPFQVEALWAKMFRSTIAYGRKGAAIECISGIDIALWDIMGKATGQPVYNLLGGKTRDQVQVYASSLFARRDLQTLASEARDLKNQGYRFMKMRMRFGPRDGPAGMKGNIERIKVVRDAIGEDIPLAAEVYMGWDVSYAVSMIQMFEAEGLNLAWVEEPVIPDDIDGYARIAAAVRTPISGGEHEFTRYGFRELIARKAVDILQPDIHRVGGITEAAKIWAMAAAYDLPVIPHVSGMPMYHLIISHLNSPLAEQYLPAPRSCFKGDFVVVDGCVTLSARPGFGLEVDQDLVESLRMGPS